MYYRIFHLHVSAWTYNIGRVISIYNKDFSSGIEKIGLGLP